MKVMFRLMMVLALIPALVSMAGLSAAQTVTTNVRINLSPLVENVRGGQIDWGKEMMYASGEGAVPSPAEAPNRARATLKAKEYAKMQAIANLFQLIEGTSISYSAVGKNFMAEDVTLKQTIQGYVRNVQIIKSVTLKEEGDTIIKVVVGTPMYGRDTPGQALLAKLSETELSDPEPAPVKIEIPKEAPKIVQPKPVVIEEPKPEEPKPEPVVKEPEVKPEEPKPVVVAKEPEVKPEEPKPAVLAGAAYTSVIIDSLGLNVMRAMSPKIRTRNGDEVWGTIKMSADEVQDHGPVAYTRSVADAKKSSRAGSNPLMVKAVGRAGGTRMCDVVLSDDDVAQLKAADLAARPPFLAAMKVIVVVDPTKAF